MGIVAEALHELLRGFVEHGVVRDLAYPVLKFSLGWQVSEENQVGDLEEATVFSQHLDGVAAITQNTAFAVDESDGALAGRSVHERRIIGHQSEIFRIRFDLPNVRGTNRPVLNRECVRSVGAIINNREAIL